MLIFITSIFKLPLQLICLPTNKLNKTSISGKVSVNKNMAFNHHINKFYISFNFFSYGSNYGLMALTTIYTYKMWSSNCNNIIWKLLSKRIRWLMEEKNIAFNFTTPLSSMYSKRPQVIYIIFHLYSYNKQIVLH